MRADQRHDGSWPMKTVGGVVEDASGETNMSAYLAVGVWHHWLLRRDLAFVERMWPVVRRGLDFVVGMQLPFGGIAWSQEWDAHGPAKVNQEALVAGSSSIYQSLRAGVALAELMDDPQPEWELAGGRLGHALREHRDLFLDKSTFSMDWYYPVLGGAVRGAGRARPARRALGRLRGARPRHPLRRHQPVGDRRGDLRAGDGPRRLGDHDRALRLFADMQHLRHDDGSYWTGYVYPEDVFWPARAHHLHLGRRDPRRRRPVRGPPRRSGIMRGETLATHFRGDRAGVWLPGGGSDGSGRQPSSPAAPEVLVSTRIDPTVSGRLERAAVNRAQPHVERRLAAVLGRSNTSWMTSAPPGSSQWAKPE